MANGGRGPEREWATLAIASLGAFIACLVVLPEHDATPWYLTLAMATAAGVFLVPPRSCWPNPCSGDADPPRHRDGVML